jgi:hypothetical protein
MFYITLPTLMMHGQTQIKIKMNINLHSPAMAQPITRQLLRGGLGSIPAQSVRELWW